MEQEVKTILMISNMYPNKRRKTYGIFIKNQVEALLKKNYTVDVLAIKDPRKGKFFLLKKYVLWFLKSLIILITKGKKYDIIHAHYIFPSGLLALIFKKVFRSKVVITSHGGDINQMPNKGKVIYQLTKKILQKADAIIAVGEELQAQMIQNFHVPEEKLTVLNMGVNRNIFTPKISKEKKEHFNLSNKNFYLLFVGNLIREKGVLDLLEAYALLKRKYPFIKLHLIGATIDEAFNDQLEKVIEEKQLGGVTFHSPMGQEQLAQWMHAADAFVLPSHMEGFGLVALEAMSTHTPVIGTNVGGLKYLLKDGAGVLVEKENPKALAEGIEQVLIDEKLRQDLIHKGEKVAEKNCEEEIINQLICIYNGM